MAAAIFEAQSLESNRKLLPVRHAPPRFYEQWDASFTNLDFRREKRPVALERGSRKFHVRAIFLLITALWWGRWGGGGGGLDKFDETTDYKAFIILPIPKTVKYRFKTYFVIKKK